ncbi:hypothetical protein Poli38472_012191 [Pythium oligandrum]|uniref:Cytochrome P450 n=1 Tax=Pythium oligandrum TaxID=41045 RepID=A0A8K1CPF0_PYTOL|nr:hypothetical protein Poli38472_012191 [Pythium oligandrum]|eukprot:TMW67075.1 hypothetical protein Poli38472_012191 [Pythium oligandrum]
MMAHTFVEELWRHSEHVHPVTVTVTIAILVGLVWIRNTKSSDKHGVREIRQLPGTLPLLGDTLTFGNNIHRLYDWFTSLAEQYKGEPFMIRLIGSPPLVYFTTVEAYEEILKTKFDNFPKGPQIVENMGDLFGRGIFVSDHASWAA